MASQGRSRWEAAEEESDQAIARRRRDKEEKKRTRRERMRKAEAQQQQANEKSPLTPEAVHGDVEKSSKRLKKAEVAHQLGDGDGDGDGDGVVEEPKLLSFSTRRFAACRSVEEYERLNDIEEGSYGLVSRARERRSGTVVALKKLKMDHANDGFPVTGIREIQTLMASRHPHIVFLREVVMGTTLRE
jgi:cell division cycle 2-like